MRATSDWRAVVQRPDIDVVDICTPNDSHAAIAIAAAEAGKHIICEKPLARGGEEAKTMLDAVKKAGVIHMVAFNYRRTPAVALARKYIEDGRNRHDTELSRHLSAGLVGRSGLASLLALPEEDRRLRLDWRHRHACGRPRPLPCRRNRRGERADADLHTRRGPSSRGASTSWAPLRSPPTPSVARSTWTTRS